MEIDFGGHLVSALSLSQIPLPEKETLCGTRLPPQGQGETWPYQIVRDALRRVLAIRTAIRSRLSPAIVPLLAPDELW
jgi:hypothetical protein